MGASSASRLVLDRHDRIEAPRSRRRTGPDVILRRLLAAGDCAAVILALLVVLAIPLGGSFRPVRVLWGLAAVPIMLVLFKLYGLYDRDVKRISHSTVDDLPWLVHAVVIGTLLVWLYSRYTGMHRLDFAEVVIFALATTTLVASLRAVVRAVAARVVARERALLVGSGPQALALVGKLRAHAEYGVEPVGWLAAPNQGQADVPVGLPALGALSDLADVVALTGATRIVLAGGEIEEPELELLLRDCRERALKVSMLPKLSDVLGPAVEIDDVEGVAVLGINPPWLPRSSRALKRAMDVAIALPTLLIVSPLLALLAFAIRLDSSGSVFFSQERVGRGGRRFRLLKLRTMVTDAEQLQAELLSQSADPDWLLLDRDPRITRLGRWLRRLSLDEMPQLWNVLRGEMSIVGPRPLIPSEDERVQTWARGRLDLTPGITGYWQVLGRTRIPFEEMIKLDYLYVMNWSLWEDLRLILRTLPAVIGGRGAN